MDQNKHKQTQVVQSQVKKCELPASFPKESKIKADVLTQHNKIRRLVNKFYGEASVVMHD